MHQGNHGNGKTIEQHDKYNEKFIEQDSVNNVLTLKQAGQSDDSSVYQSSNNNHATVNRKVSNLVASRQYSQ